MNLPLSPLLLLIFQAIVLIIFGNGLVLYVFFHGEYKKVFKDRPEHKQAMILKGMKEGKYMMLGSTIIYLMFFVVAPVL